MAGYRETFSGNIDYASGGSRDIGSRINGGVSQLGGLGSSVGQLAGQARQARAEMKGLRDEIASLKDQQKAVDENSAAYIRLGQQIKNATRQLSNLKANLIKLPLGGIEKGLGSITKGLLSMNAGILGMAFGFLIDSIKRVYELQEKWAKAIGGFNMKLGGMTAGLSGATKAATRWSGVIRGLTNGDIQEGIELFGEFTIAIGRVVKTGDEIERAGLQFARGFNMGGTGAGEFLKVLENIGMQKGDFAEVGKTIIKSANAANIPTNMLADDLKSATGYMARFGKEGTKTFIQGAAYARKFDIAVKQLQASVEKFDMFDDAAKSAAEMNAAFGTMINSMDLMLEDDPAARLDMIRQQFLAQGHTFDNLSPKQRRYFSELMNLSEEQTAALLTSGQSYAEFQAKAAAREKNELSAKKMMEKQLRATAQTLYAFGAAFDRITVAIANAIKPILVVFGLAKSGGKDFKSFGQVMESITVTVEKFFNSLAGNDKWNMFMVTLAKDIKRVGGALKDFVVSGGAAKLVGRLAENMQRFYTWVRDAGIAASKYLGPVVDIFFTLSKHLREIGAGWMLLKAVNFGVGLKTPSGRGGSSDEGEYGGVFSGLKKGFSKRPSSRLGRLAGRATKGGAGLGAVTGGLAGAAMGGTGAMLGGMIGGMGGPLLGIVGAGVGKLIEMGIDYFFPKKKSELEKSREELADIQKKLAASTALLSREQDVMLARQLAADARRTAADKSLNELRNKKATLESQDINLLTERAQQLANFSDKNKNVSAALESLKNNIKPNSTQLQALLTASVAYNTQLESLRTTAAQLAEIQRTSVEFQMAERAVKQGELDIQAKKLDLDKAKANREATLKNAADALGVDASQANNFFFGRRADSDTNKAERQYLAYKREQDARVNKAELDALATEKKLELQKFELAKKQFHVFTRQQLLIGDEFNQFVADNKGKMSRNEMEQKFLFDKLSAPDSGFDAETRSGIINLGRAAGRKPVAAGGHTQMAAGGIVTTPTRAIIGEGGPEAVIPLRTSARGLPWSTDSVVGRMVQNMAGGPKQRTVVTQIADIHIDGQKVGRALVQTAIQE